MRDFVKETKLNQAIEKQEIKIKLGQNFHNQI